MFWKKCRIFFIEKQKFPLEHLMNTSITHLKGAHNVNVQLNGKNQLQSIGVKLPNEVEQAFNLEYGANSAVASMHLYVKISTGRTDQDVPGEMIVLRI